MQRVKEGDVDHTVRALIAETVTPVLTVSRRIGLPGITLGEDHPKTTDNLLWIDFAAPEYTAVREFLSVWPQEVQHEVALIRTVSRSLVDTLEEAEDAGFPSDAPPVEHHNVIYASGTPCETLLSPGEQPCAPLLRYCWRRGLLKSHLRSIVVPWTDLRQPVDIIREELDARRAALLRQLR